MDQEYAQMKITPLLLAAQRNSIDILQLLLKNGVGIVIVYLVMCFGS